MSAAIVIEELNKTYPRSWKTPPFEAVRKLSLTVCEGEVFGFIGPNGAGKSTVIKVLTGVLRPTAGRAELFGKDVSLPEARRGLGYVPENPSLYDYLTPLEILTMGLAIHGVKLPDPRQHCMQWLERFALAQVASKRVRSFSKGMTQRVALAHAMAIQPRLLILDEPLSGLDPGWSQGCRRHSGRLSRFWRNDFSDFACAARCRAPRRPLRLDPPRRTASRCKRPAICSMLSKR
jgi:ABC-2 type transport system ATP-binding protein